MNVQTWLKITTINLTLALGLILSGCGVKPVHIQSECAPKAPLDIPDLPSLQLQSIKWVIITPNNEAKVFAKLKKENFNAVLFGLTSVGYEHLGLNMAKINKHLVIQHKIIKDYKRYYESPKKKSNKPTKNNK